MAGRYFVAEGCDATRVTLRDAEGHHLARVMRAQPGDEVELFDGRGSACTARVRQVTRDQVELEVVRRHPAQAPPAASLTLAVALPKGDRQRWLVEKAVELGVERLVPLRTRRSVAQPAAKTLQRLRRTVVEACKQSGRNRLMEIPPDVTLDELLAAPPEGAECWLAHPAGSPLGCCHGPAGVRESTPLLAAVGPEGGWNPDEIERAREAGWTLVGLGPRILRVETAALALASWVLLQATSRQVPPPGSE